MKLIQANENDIERIDQPQNTVPPANGKPSLSMPPIKEFRVNDGHEDFKEMRKHLTTVRRYHVAVLAIVMFGFLFFVGIAILMLLFVSFGILSAHEPADKLRILVTCLGSLGSGGIGTALLPFLKEALSEHRTSQVELAYFESLVAEARESLAEISKSSSSEQKRQIRAEIWEKFRAGLSKILTSRRKD